MESLVEDDMLNALLQTKLYVPRPKPRLVSCPRPLGKLDHLRERKLVLVSAPADFGKTTLLSEWIEHQDKGQDPLQVVWLSLDEQQRDRRPAGDQPLYGQVPCEQGSMLAQSSQPHRSAGDCPAEQPFGTLSGTGKLKVAPGLLAST